MNKYYQAQSEIDDITEVHPSYGVYHSKKECQKIFPNSEIAEMDYQTIEAPSFMDLKEIKVEDKKVLEALKYIVNENTYVSWEDLTDNNSPCFNSDFAFCVLEKTEQLPDLLEVQDKMNFVGANEDFDELNKVYFESLSALEKGESVSIFFVD